jgi:hypothetical protein
MTPAPTTGPRLETLTPRDLMQRLRLLESAHMWTRDWHQRAQLRTEWLRVRCELNARPTADVVAALGA